MTTPSIASSLAELAESGERLLLVEDELRFEEELEVFIGESERVIEGCREPLEIAEESALKAFIPVHQRVAERAKQLQSGISGRIAALERNRPGLIKYWASKPIE